VLKFWPEFFLGILVYLFCRSEKKWEKVVPVGLLIVIPAALFGLKGATDRFWMLGGASLFGLLLCALFPMDGRLSDSRAWHGLAVIGGFSYSLYLIHVPFGGAWKNLLSRVIPPGSPGFLFLQASYWAVSIGAAFLFYQWVEKPWEKVRKSRFR
jgi:peptidoglycan/LPS O-acetylase OafA/YrhL